MTTKAIFLANIEETNQAEEMGIAPPEPRYETQPFAFRLSAVEFAHVSTETPGSGDKAINIYLQGRIEAWTIVYDSNTWDRITHAMEENQ